jgi:hypothetical protein
MTYFAPSGLPFHQVKSLFLFMMSFMFRFAPFSPFCFFWQLITEKCADMLLLRSCSDGLFITFRSAQWQLNAAKQQRGS